MALINLDSTYSELIEFNFDSGIRFGSKQMQVQIQNSRIWFQVDAVATKIVESPKTKGWTTSLWIIGPW